MEIQITSKEAKPLLQRSEIRARIAFQGATPTKHHVIAAVAKALKTEQSLVIVRRIVTAYGDQSAEVLAYVYNDAATLEKLEHDYVKKKHGVGKKEGEEKPAEAAAPAKEGGDE